MLPLAVTWTGVIWSLAGLSGTLTLGRWSHRLINVWGPLWARGMFWLLGVRLRVVGREHIATRAPRVVLMNHCSALDMIALCALNPPGFMALVKREFAYNPLFGWALWVTGQHFIDRRNRRAARASMEQLALRMRRQGRSVAIYPEGTRSRTGALQPFKSGAFHLLQQTGAPMVPVVIHGAWALAPGSTLIVRAGDLVVHVHPPRPTDQWREEDVKAHARELHDEYERWLAEGPPAA